MKLSELRYDFPSELVATVPVRPSRVMWVPSQGAPAEISVSQLLNKISPGDMLVLNDTRVLKRRVFAERAEVLFLSQVDPKHWQVLFPASRFRLGDRIDLPQVGSSRESLWMELVEKGSPQLVRTNLPLTEEYFQQVAQLPLPPYIQKARGERQNQPQDEAWYQTAWAEKDGSFAAPTASLHFTSADLEGLKQRGVLVEKITLHVGLGTFLPVSVEDLKDHQMHEEWLEIPASVWTQILAIKARGGKIWALGTTVTRALEAVGKAVAGNAGLMATSTKTPSTSADKTGLVQDVNCNWVGWTGLMISPGHKWVVVDRLLTNFHQPESTLLALVAGFRDLATVRSAYAWAIEKKYRLFSYGDLSAWERV